MTKRRMQSIIVSRTKTVCDLDGSELTETQLEQRLAQLRARHEYLLEHDERYRRMHNSVPDRSDYETGLPLRSRAVVPAMQAWEEIIKSIMRNRYQINYQRKVAEKKKQERSALKKQSDDTSQ